jgi:hypothetical protein
MDSVKKWWESSGIWGAVGTIVVSLGAALGYQIDPTLVNDTVVWGSSIATAVTGIVALWGRWRATAKIKTT